AHPPQPDRVLPPRPGERGDVVRLAYEERRAEHGGRGPRPCALHAERGRQRIPQSEPPDHSQPAARGLPLEDPRLREPVREEVQSEAETRAQEPWLREVGAELVVQLVAKRVVLERTTDRSAESGVQRISDPDLAH